MQWLEIIELRTGSDNRESLWQLLKDISKELSHQADKPLFRIYSSFSVDSDFSVHLIHRHSRPDLMGSPIGLQIASSLRDFGLLNHQIWCEMDNHFNQQKAREKS